MDRKTLETNHAQAILTILGAIEHLPEPGRTLAIQAVQTLDEARKSLDLGRREIAAIRDFGVREFHTAQNMPARDPKDLQIFLVVSGLETLLLTKGISPNFQWGDKIGKI